MLQVVADALDIEIFMYSPQYSPDGTVTWERYVRGQPQNDSARQIHIANYMHARHWTALTPVGAGPITLPALGEMNRHPIPGSGIRIPALTRLEPGDEYNTDLRNEELHDDPEDGHVADTTETAEEEDDDDAEDEEMDEEEDADGDDGPPPPSSAGAAAATTSSAAARRVSSSGSQPSRSSSAPATTGRGSRSPSASRKKGARRRARSKSKSKSRSTSQPSGVQKNVQPTQPLSKNARKKKTKALRKIFEDFFVGMPSPQNMGGAVRSPYPLSTVLTA